MISGAFLGYNGEEKKYENSDDEKGRKGKKERVLVKKSIEKS